MERPDILREIKYLVWSNQIAESRETFRGLAIVFQKGRLLWRGDRVGVFVAANAWYQGISIIDAKTIDTALVAATFCTQSASVPHENNIGCTEYCNRTILIVNWEQSRVQLFCYTHGIKMQLHRHTKSSEIEIYPVRIKLVSTHCLVRPIGEGMSNVQSFFITDTCTGVSMQTYTHRYHNYALGMRKKEDLGMVNKLIQERLARDRARSRHSFAFNRGVHFCACAFPRRTSSVGSFSLAKMHCIH